MMNRYPIWGYLALTAVILIGALYAIPNLYPEDPSVQISHDSGSLPADLKQRVESILSLNEMEAKQIEVNQQQQLLLRFDNTELQLQAADELKSGLNSEHIVALNLAPAVPAWLRAVNASPMSLGLDLRGGVHFLLQVDMTAAVSKALDRYEADFRSVLRENKVRYISVKHNGDVLNATFKDEESYQQGLDALKENFRLDLDFTKIKAERGITLVAAFKLAAQQELQNFALQQNITTLRKRVNELGVAEPVIQRQGTDRIVVQLPGVQDTARAKELLGATATLECRLVDEQGDAFAAESSGNTPIGDKLYYERNGTPVLLKSRVMLSGEYITDAASGIDQDTATPAVFITLDGKGSRLFSKVTGDNIKRLMAVVFIESKTEYFKDEQGQLQSRSRKVEEVINIARIQDQLSKRFQITGLASWLGAQMSMLQGLSLILLVLVIIGLVNFFTEFTSNLATTAMLLPILAPIAISLNINPYILMVACTLAASCAFMMPVATPPNAVVFGSGYLRIPDMIKSGIWMNILSIIFLTIMVCYMLPIIWDFDPSDFSEFKTLVKP